MQSPVTILQISGIAALLQTSPRVGGPRPTSADRSRASHPWPAPAGLAVAAAAATTARMAGRRRRRRRRTGAMVSKRARVPPPCHLPPRALGQLYGSGGGEPGGFCAVGDCAGAAAAARSWAAAWSRTTPATGGRMGGAAGQGRTDGRGSRGRRWAGTSAGAMDGDAGRGCFWGYCCRRSEFRERKSFRI